jgi:PAS domain S-box-containing protein
MIKNNKNQSINYLFKLRWIGLSWFILSNALLWFFNSTLYLIFIHNLLNISLFICLYLFFQSLLPLVVQSSEDTPITHETSDILTKKKTELQALEKRINELSEANYHILGNQIINPKNIQSSNESGRKQLGTIFSQVKDVIYSIYPTSPLTIFFANMAVQDIYGYSVAEFKAGSIWYEAIIDEDKPLIDNILANFNQTRASVYEIEYRIKHKSGEIRWLLDKFWLIKQANGNLLQIDGYIKDITLRKETQFKLKEINELLEVAEVMAQIGSYEWDVLHSKSHWSKNQLRIYGIDPESKTFVPRLSTFLDRVYPEDRELAKKALLKVYNEKIELTWEIRIVLDNGQVRNLITRTIPRFNEKGEVVKLFGVTRDITEKRSIEQALIFSNQEFQNIRKALHQSAIISILNVNGHIIDVNNFFCVHSQMDKDELIGRNFKALLDIENYGNNFDDIWQTVLTGQSWRGELCNKAKDGSLYWLDTFLNPLMDDTDMPYQFLCIQYLITDRKKAESEREALIQNLLEFAQITSHRLRKPVANIIGLVELFNFENLADVENIQIIQSLAISAQELDEIVHTMNKIIDSKNIRRRNLDS